LIEQAGFTDVWNMVGGIVKWTEENLPVETPPTH
jgi:rhodanese-related sulfurtransferase